MGKVVQGYSNKRLVMAYCLGMERVRSEANERVSSEAALGFLLCQSSITSKLNLECVFVRNS